MDGNEGEETSGGMLAGGRARSNTRVGGNMTAAELAEAARKASALFDKKAMRDVDEGHERRQREALREKLKQRAKEKEERARAKAEEAKRTGLGSSLPPLPEATPPPAGREGDARPPQAGRHAGPRLSPA